MEVWRVVVGVILLLCASLIQLNPNLVDNWTENSNSDAEQEDYRYTLIQSEERWLVLPVSFSNNNVDISKIEQLFSGEGSAEEYLSLMTNGATELEVEVKDVWKTSSPVKQWGEDVDGERDYGSDGNGVESLVNSVVFDVLSEEDLSPWDLNNDGVIDRLLLIHSAPPQESTGNSNSFWSHFSLMDNPIEIQDWRIEHYVVASIDSGLGTIVHESLHSMGALDLYDVHDELPTSNWNGVGDWGIMASGNWNGEGDIPAMPISSTLDLIGVNNSIEVDTSIQSSFELYPLT
ncbi:MAG TPA: immune inhibitor A, partial [Candidatus Thalassarchaeaceae archaeon]|nr:immune inhibitor A [Candidatus Thalassarchaeaceae archaeon]